MANFDAPALAHLVQQAEQDPNPRVRANAEEARRELNLLIERANHHVPQDRAIPEARSPEEAGIPDDLGSLTSGA